VTYNLGTLTSSNSGSTAAGFKAKKYDDTARAPANKPSSVNECERIALKREPSECMVKRSLVFFVVPNEKQGSQLLIFEYVSYNLIRVI